MPKLEPSVMKMRAFLCCSPHIHLHEVKDRVNFAGNHQRLRKTCLKIFEGTNYSGIKVKKTENGYCINLVMKKNSNVIVSHR